MNVSYAYKRILGCLALLTSTSLANSQGLSDKDRKQLQGKWEVISIISKVGKEEPKRGERLCVIEGGKFTSKEGATISGEANFTLDANKSPKTIDLKSTSGDDKGKTFLGIYELAG